ncbi:MAG: hypothetical protein GX601_17230, partial [Anaerolineales bacterium]|nr:hypothetical protein [Anaerolineales bacterium]
TDSKHYRSVERSLERLLRASIVAEGAFWDADRQGLVQRVNGFHLIERYWLAYQEGDEQVVEAEGCPGYVVWGEEVWRSLQNGYLKQLDLDTFFHLQTPVARRLYRFLDKKLHKRRQLEIDIFQLSQQLGMAYYRYPAKVKEKLQPGIDELMGIGFLASGEMVKCNATRACASSRRWAALRWHPSGAIRRLKRSRLLMPWRLNAMPVTGAPRRQKLRASSRGSPTSGNRLLAWCASRSRPPLIRPGWRARY